MPGQTGFAVCRAAKGRPETRLTPIVLITGLGRVEDRIQGIEAGAATFSSKPVRKEELLARVKSLERIKRFDRGAHLRTSEIVRAGSADHPLAS